MHTILLSENLYPGERSLCFSLLFSALTFYPICGEQVPALVLDCEPNIDFSKDVEAKRQ